MVEVKGSPGFHTCTVNSGEDRSKDPYYLDFLHQLDIFHKTIRPVWKERHKEDTESGVALQEYSGFYCFFDENFYAFGHVEENNCRAFTYDDTPKLIDAIWGEMKEKDLDSMIFSTPNTKLKFQVAEVFNALGLSYENGILYDPNFII